MEIDEILSKIENYLKIEKTERLATEEDPKQPYKLTFSAGNIFIYPDKYCIVYSDVEGLKAASFDSIEGLISYLELNLTFALPREE